MELKNVVEGKHNKESFRYENGFLVMFDRKWDKADIKTLTETANLLAHEGYVLKEPTGSRLVDKFDPFMGGSYKMRVKEYDEKDGD